MTGLWRQYGWHAMWAAVVVVLIALPVIVLTTRGTPSVTPTGMLPPSSTAPSSAPPVPAHTPATGDEPLCSNVWQKGKTLPGSYRGCQSGGDLVARTYLPGQRCLQTYDHQYFAAQTGIIHAMTPGWRRSRAYAEAQADCKAA